VTRRRIAWRLLVHPPADGAWNMALDESLLETYAGDAPPDAPTLRLYGWAPPALSLGRFQRAVGSHDATFLRENGIDLVRRPTGGSAVLHEFERTYAVVARLRREPFPGGVVDTYRRLAGALCSALGRLGLHADAREARAKDPAWRTAAACFAAPSTHEVTVGAEKVVGSAQLRRRGAFLQHGSILLRADPERLARAIGLERAPRGYTDLARALGAAPGESAVDRAMVAAFEAEFGARLEPGRPTAVEQERARHLRCSKYLTRAWTLEGEAS
jgi:lipoate-protein ligase A